MQKSKLITLSMEKTSASFELISHPDRSLRTHLASCDAISQKILALKSFNADVFYSADLLETMRHLLVYFHDFGKGSFFQLKIINATEEAIDNIDFKKEVQPYIDFFNKNRRVIFEKEIEKKGSLGNHAKLGSYFVLPNFEHEDIIVRFILLKIIQRHHGNLTNFFVSTANKHNGGEKLQIQLDVDSIAFLEKQIEQQDFELYQNILNEQSLTTDKNCWAHIKTELLSGRRFTKIQSAFEAKKEVKYFFLQHFLFSLLLSADKGDMMLNGDTKSELSFLKNHKLPLSIIDNYKDWKHSGQEPLPIDKIREEAYLLVAENVNKYKEKAFFSITLPTCLGKTYTAYNAAVILQNAFFDQSGQVPRIVYVLPFTSIIDQNEAILREIMSITEGVESSWLSKNHYLSDYNKKYDDSELLKDEPEYLADGWEQDIFVTTFVQLG